MSAKEKKQEWVVPQDIMLLFDEATGCRVTLERLCRFPFTTKKIIALAKEQGRLRAKAWRLLKDVYPELVGRECYVAGDRATVVDGKADD